MDRRSLLAASLPTFNGDELPTEIPKTGAADEARANLFDFLSSLTIDGSPVNAIAIYTDRLFISTQYSNTSLYQDGNTSSSQSGGVN